MSDRLYTKVCDSCGGICPLQAVTCRYCKADFAPESWAASPLLKKGPLRILLIISAILLAALVLYTKNFRK